MSSAGDLSERFHDTKAYQELGANVAKAGPGAGGPHTIACNGISRIGDRSKGRKRQSGAQDDGRHFAGSGDGRKRVTMVKTLGRAMGRRFWGSWACRDRGEYEELRGLWLQVLNNRRRVRTARALLNRAHATADSDIDECSAGDSRGADQNCGSMTTVMAWSGVRLSMWWSQV